METDLVEDEFEYPFESYAGYEYDCEMQNPYDEW